MVDGINWPTKKRILEFFNLIKYLREKKKEMNLSDFLDFLLEKTWYKKMLEEEDSIESKTRLENLFELKSVLLKFDEFWEESLEKFLEEVSLISDSDEISEKMI